MPPIEVRAFLQRRQDKYDRRDPADLAADHHTNGTVHSPIFPTVEGRAAIEASYRALFTSFPDWQITFDTAIVDDTRAVHPFVARATHTGDFMGLRGSGRRFEITGALMYDLQDGLILTERRIYDFTGLLMQVGVLRGKPAK